MMENRVLFESFNARYLTYKEIAESFIPNTQFNELIKNNHSLLMGPRGSGKTTLLKMLTPSALYSWKHIHAHQIRNSIPFFGIYIPTDIQWKRQIENFELEFNDDPKFTNITSKAVVTTNVLIAAIKTFAAILSTKIDDEEKRLKLESELAIEIINTWKLDKPISPTFYSIEMSLRNRILEINNYIKKLKYSSESLISQPDYIYDEYMDLLDIACIAFENKVKNIPQFVNQTFRWALCFDELEIAPKWLQYQLLDLLRSTDQKFIFKLTTAPIVSLYDRINNKFHRIEARQDEDYKIIRTWTYNQINQKEWSKFCTTLIESRLRRKFKKEINPNHLFGNSNLERTIVQSFPEAKFLKEDKGYFFNSASWYLLKKLAEIDPKFRNYLIGKNVNTKNPIPRDTAQADKVHRKIKPLAIYRYQFIKKEGKRSRKIIPLYYGLPFIYEMCDGNPRALIGVFDEFISNANRNEYGEIKPFTINQQSRILSEIAKRQLDLLATHPDSNKEIENRNINLGNLLKKIGEYFHDKIVDDDFTSDPPGSFFIDEDINHKIHDLMELALYLGAIIYLDPNEVTSHNGILGKKFRLSYLLSPAFNLPSREYGPIKLSSLLSKVDLNSSKQINLFS